MRHLARALLPAFLLVLLCALPPMARLYAEANATGRARESTAETNPGSAGMAAPAEGSGGLFSRGDDSTGERETRALIQAYPGRIAERAFRDGDWAVRVDDTWFFWARGRMLPAELREDWEQYASYRFYAYPLRLPEVRRLDEEERRRLELRLEAAEQDPPRRHEGFLGALYQAATRGQTESGIERVVFLGYPVSVHKALVEPLAAVERSLQRLAQSNEETREFLEGLKGFAGYNWRAIAGTRSRSYHSYGIAIDLVPKSYGGLYAYWRWALPHERQWYSLPYEKRWMVPQPIVHAFEEQGFIWGGKWFFFDTMHFEYRPELLLLARQWRVGQIRQGLQVK